MPDRASRARKVHQPQFDCPTCGAELETLHTVCEPCLERGWYYPPLDPPKAHADQYTSRDQYRDDDDSHIHKPKNKRNKKKRRS